MLAMSLFKKPKRNFRQRTTKNDSDEENNGEADIFKSQGTSGMCEILSHQSHIFDKTSDTLKRIERKEKKPVTPTGLSFDNESEGEETEVFKIKKSSYSRRLMKQVEKQKKKKAVDKEMSFNDGDEKRDYKNISDANTANSEQQAEFNTIVMNSEDIEEMELDSSNEGEDKSNDSFRKILESGSIPDAAMIHAARKRRQKVREMSEYISLSSNSEREKNNSRFLRGNDNDRSDDDDDENERRINFSAVKPAVAKKKAREAILAFTNKDENNVNDEVDEELERWEQEQIRKGVSIPQVQFHNSYSSYQPMEHVMYYNNDSLATNLPERKVNVSDTLPTPIQSTRKYALSSESYREHLLERLESRREIYRASERERIQIQNDLVLHKNYILELEETALSVSRTYTFYQEMRGYVTDLVECLDEKMEKIVCLEKNFYQLLKQRVQKLSQRSQQDIKDQSDEFMAMICKTQNSTNLFTRSPANTRRAAEREGRRARRRRARESRNQKLVHYEGMSSDDEEMESDIIQFNTEKDRLLDEANHLFDDVVEDYHVIKVIQSRFENWKETYPESYKNAYIGLCIPKVFTPFVRLQLLSWNPLEDLRDIDEFLWFEPLMFYGFSEKQTPEKLKEDNDLMVIPSIVERIILPRLTELAESVWNPVSTSQTLRLVNLVRKLINEYPLVNGKNKKTLVLLDTVVSRMRRTLDEDVYMPPYPKALLENKLLGASVFFQRQYWTCVKILRNFLSWQGIISDEILQDVALDGLLNRYILWALNISSFGKDSLEKAKMITATIPRSWFVKREHDNTIPQLEMFCKYLKSLANVFEKVSGVDKLNVIENVKELIKMFLTLGAFNHAADLANQFSIKDVNILKE